MFCAVWNGWYAGVVLCVNMSISANITLSSCVFTEGTTVGNILVAEVVLQGMSCHALIALTGCFAVVRLALGHRLVTEVVLEREASETFLADTGILIRRAVIGFWVACVVDHHVFALTGFALASGLCGVYSAALYILVAEIMIKYITCFTTITFSNFKFFK